MRNKFKGLVLGFLTLCAAFCAIFAFYSAGNAEKNVLPSTNAAPISGEAIGSSTSYVLRDYEGYVAVFIEGEPDSPITVTDIQISTLRAFDQMLLQTGMKVQTHERLLMMLEDLSS